MLPFNRHGRNMIFVLCSHQAKTNVNLKVLHTKAISSENAFTFLFFLMWKFMGSFFFAQKRRRFQMGSQRIQFNDHIVQRQRTKKKIRFRVRLLSM